MAIGTHALISDDVAFRDLALGVVDEQHRFGVQQRLQLVQLGEPDPFGVFDHHDRGRRHVDPHLDHRGRDQ